MVTQEELEMIINYQYENKGEVWKDIPGYDCIYQCSNLGNIKSLERIVKSGINTIIINKEIILKQNITYKGYLYVNLYLNGKSKKYYIHKLVAMCFLNHKPDGYLVCIDHIDGNKLNNRVDNLRLVTQRENMSFDNRKNFNNLTSKYVGVSWNKSTNKWKSNIKFNKKTYNLCSFINEIEANNKYQEAIKHINIGDFLEWFEQDKLNRKKKIV